MANTSLQIFLYKFIILGNIFIPPTKFLKYLFYPLQSERVDTDVSSDFYIFQVKLECLRLICLSPFQLLY